MTQPLLILILSADYVSGGQGAEGGPESAWCWAFPFSWVGKSGDRRLRPVLWRSRANPPLTEAPLGLLETPGFVDALA
jgi:hypothetical protein